MKFELQPGEKKLAQAEVELVVDRRLYPATLHLTSQRCVVTYAETPGARLWAFAWIVALVAKVVAHATEKVRYQIRRNKFASVEQGEGGILVFRDTGEGYAHTSFSIKSYTPFVVWEGRMRRWAAGDEDVADEPADDYGDEDDDDADAAAPLPSARVVERER
jgi:hypothetical protein